MWGEILATLLPGLAISGHWLGVQKWLVLAPSDGASEDGGLLLGMVAGVVLSLCLEALKSYIATHTMTSLHLKSSSR